MTTNTTKTHPLQTTLASCVFLLGATTLSVAHAEQAPTRIGEATSPELKASTKTPLLKVYARKKEQFNYTLTKIADRRKFTEWKMTFPSAVVTEYAPNNTVHANYYQPKGKPGETFPAVVVLHHLAGSTEPEELLARHYANHKVAALVLTFPFYGPRRPSDARKRLVTASIDDLKRIVVQAVHDVRRCADFLRALPEVDSKRVGVLGVSLGAIIGSLSAGVDGRFSKVVLVLGGGALDEIVTNESREVRSLRRALKELGWDKNRLKHEIRMIEPLNFAHRLKSQNVLMLNASRDEIIPMSSTKKLHEALGKPQIHWYQTGHYGAALHILNLLRRSLKFVKKPAAQD